MREGTDYATIYKRQHMASIMYKTTGVLPVSNVYTGSVFSLC